MPGLLAAAIRQAGRCSWAGRRRLGEDEGSRRARRPGPHTSPPSPAPALIASMHHSIVLPCTAGLGGVGCRAPQPRVRRAQGAVGWLQGCGGGARSPQACSGPHSASLCPTPLPAPPPLPAASEACCWRLWDLSSGWRGCSGSSCIATPSATETEGCLPGVPTLPASAACCPGLARLLRSQGPA